MAEIVGGLNIRDVAEGGAEFKTRPCVTDQTANDDVPQKDYLEAVDEHANLDCLNIEDEGAVSGEPFEIMARKMTNVLPTGKIKKRILRKGYGEKPQNTSCVRINYNAYIEYEAQPFDSTYARKKPFSFTIGEGQVIEGLEIAVQSMQINEKAQFLIESDLAYRNSGLNRIPPNSTVLFEIELHETVQSENNTLEKELKDFNDIYKYCLGLCVKGKHRFRLIDYSGAAKEYEVAVDKMENALLNDYNDQLKSDELLARLYTNLIICYTHMETPKKACRYANKVFDLAKSRTIKVSAKVYFNNAKCLKMLGDFCLAKKRLEIARKMEPRNPEILQEFVVLKAAREEYHNKLKAFGKALVEGV